MTDGMATASEVLDEEGNTNDSAFGVRSLQVNTLNWIYIIYIYIYKSLSKWQPCNDTSIVSRGTLA